MAGKRGHPFNRHPGEGRDRPVAGLTRAARDPGLRRDDV